MKGVVATTPPLAAEVGVQILESGGNAVDAAVATAFAQTVTDPWMCGMGGFGTANIYMADTGTNIAVQFFARAGSKVRPDQWVDQGARQVNPGGMCNWVFDDFRNEIGYTSVCVPGTVAGLHEIHQRFGSISWERVLALPIELAKNGWKVTPIHEAYWTSPPGEGKPEQKLRLTATEPCQRLYTREDGSVLQAGDLYVNGDMARTLERLALEGAGDFYQGEIGATLAQAFEEHGAHVTGDDLAEYRVRVVEPLQVEYRGYTMSGDPPPSGGYIVLQMLKILEGYPLAEMGHNSADYLHVLAGAMAIAQDDRRKFEGDVEFVQVPVEYLLSDEYLTQCRRRIDAGDFPQATYTNEHPQNTTILTTADANGNIASINHTLGTGSGVVVPGLGFVLNNFMNGFHLSPSHPNGMAPGKATAAPFAPVMVFGADGSPVLATGAPGGTKIVSAVLQTILNVIEFNMGAQEAVCAARIHHEGGPLQAESRVTSLVLNELKKRGHELEVSLEAYDRGLASPHVSMFRNGQLHGGADPRRGGSVLFSQK